MMKKLIVFSSLCVCFAFGAKAQWDAEPVAKSVKVESTKTDSLVKNEVTAAKPITPQPATAVSTKTESKEVIATKPATPETSKTVSEKELKEVKNVNTSMDWMIADLGLTAEQTEKLHTILYNFDQKTQDIKDSFDTWEGKQAKMKSLRSVREQDIRKLLNVEQIKKYEILKEEYKKKASKALEKK